MKILFLVRAYNDFDHFAPIIVFLASRGHKVSFGFTGDFEIEDYRVSLCEKAGACRVRFRLLSAYHSSWRPKLSRWCSERVLDRSIGLVLGLYYLRKFGPKRIIVEWGGPSGRGMARYMLAPARTLRLPIFCLPHGYHIWKNKLVTNQMKTLGGRHAKFDFSERNKFVAYVVQSENIKGFFRDRNIQESKVRVLGSPRFSGDWCRINLQAASYEIGEKIRDIPKPFIVVFLGNWDYRLNKAGCLQLLARLAQSPRINTVIKGHSRGDLIGGLNSKELEEHALARCIYADGAMHSNCLIAASIGIVNFASSIGLEAIVQGKPVCNPAYLTENSTIFTGSGVVFDAFSDEDVVKFAHLVCQGETPIKVSENSRLRFLNEHVMNWTSSSNLLDNYEKLLTS